MFLGLTDVKDCFHRLRIPKWLARRFSWRPVPALVVGLAGRELEGKILEPFGSSVAVTWFAMSGILLGPLLCAEGK